MYILYTTTPVLLTDFVV